MPITDIFSKRQKRIRGEVPDVYQYEIIPDQLRVQIANILEDAFEEQDYGPEYGQSFTDYAFQYIHKTLKHEYGVCTLGDSYESSHNPVIKFFMETDEVEKAIDFIEISFKFLNYEFQKYKERQIYNDAIDELNYRFREHGVGYQYESNIIIRVDSQFIHTEVTKPALNILTSSIYEGAKTEFLSAFEHYRARRHEDCLNNCLKAFESCLKTIAKKEDGNLAAVTALAV